MHLTTKSTLICLIFCLSIVRSGFAEEPKALNLPHQSSKVDEQKDDELQQLQQALEPYDVNEGYMNDEDMDGVHDTEEENDDGDNVNTDKRARFAFAKRSRFAFAKRPKFAFAKRARFAFAKRAKFAFAKRPNFAFAKRPSFAFAKRAGPSRFAFAKKSEEE